MEDIKQPVGDNLGGLLRFNYIPVKDVESIPDAIDGKVVEEVVVKEGKRWYAGYATQGTIGFSEPTEKNPAGTIFKPLFVGVCPQDNEQNNFLFHQKRDQQFIIDITDSNGLRRLVGSIAEGLEFSAALSTQTDVAGRNGYNISYSGDTTHRSYIYDI
jgi:hypothetical protein